MVSAVIELIAKLFATWLGNQEKKLPEERERIIVVPPYPTQTNEVEKLREELKSLEQMISQTLSQQSTPTSSSRSSHQSSPHQSQPTQHPEPSRQTRPFPYWLGLTNSIYPQEMVTYMDSKSIAYGQFVITRGRHSLYLPHEFKMGIFPITNEAFLEFIRAGGYAKASYWNQLPQANRSKFLCRDKSGYGPSTWPSQNRFPSGTTGRHPVGGICYYEVLAFCHWLQVAYPPEQGWRWKPPTEDMWELTARTERGYAYPWGNDFHINYCNSIEAGIGTTTDVDRFPNGRSQAGCYDMAGNVWEFVDALPEPDRDDLCVLRGGSHKNNKEEVCSFLRLYRVPMSHRPPDFGFRLALVHDDY